MKTYTWRRGRITPGVTVTSIEKGKANVGKASRSVVLGELGESRRSLSLQLADNPKLSPAVLDGKVHEMVVSPPSAGREYHLLRKPRPRSKTARSDVDGRVLIRVMTGWGRARRAEGSWAPIAGRPEELAAGQGAFGKRGYFGRWADALLALSPGDVIRVAPSGGRVYALWLEDGVPATGPLGEWEGAPASGGPDSAPVGASVSGPGPRTDERAEAVGPHPEDLRTKAENEIELLRETITDVSSEELTSLLEGTAEAPSAARVAALEAADTDWRSSAHLAWEIEQASELERLLVHEIAEGGDGALAKLRVRLAAVRALAERELPHVYASELRVLEHPAYRELIPRLDERVERGELRRFDHVELEFLVSAAGHKPCTGSLAARCGQAQVRGLISDREVELALIADLRSDRSSWLSE